MEPDSGRKKSLFERLQHCDPRYLYIFFFIIVFSFILLIEYVKLPIPILPSKHTKNLYNTIESLPNDKIVFVDSDWSIDMRAEHRGQFKSVLEHIMKRKLKFAMISWVGNIQGQKNGLDTIAEVGQEYGYVYGEDYVVFPVQAPAGGALIQAIARDVIGTIGTDINGTPLDDFEKLPIMKNFRNIYDVSLIFSCAYDWTRVQWLGFINGVYGTPYAIAVATITTSTAYPFLDSKQMCGMLAGATGGAEYEELLKMDNDKRFSRNMVGVLSMAVCYILLVILLGNLSYYFSLWKQRRAGVE